MRANEHLDAARNHDQQARQRTAWPDRMGSEGQQPPVPWTRSWDPGIDHERLAAIHRSEAATLYAAYHEACGARSSADVAISPLRRHATGVWNTSTGAIVYLEPVAGGPDKLIADLACHRAWMMLAPAGMDDCPLDLPGLVIDARGEREGITLSIHIRDRRLVDELHRRLAHDVESRTTR
jgi:hypothetical protein